MKENLDQHFMVDRALIKRIIGYSNLKEKDIALEIGPGKGFLTKELVKKCKVIAVEKDESFKKELDKLAKINNNLTIHYGNVLKLIKKLKFNKIVSNIPYNISEPLMKSLFRIQTESILTVSKSFAEKISNKKTKIGMQTGLFFRIETKEKVSKKAFLPRPRTESAVILLTPREEESLETKEIILRNFILLDNKKTKNALMESLVKGLKLTKRKSREIIEKTGLQNNILEKNSDLLSLEEFLKLKNSLSKAIK